VQEELVEVGLREVGTDAGASCRKSIGAFSARLCFYNKPVNCGDVLVKHCKSTSSCDDMKVRAMWRQRFEVSVRSLKLNLGTECFLFRIEKRRGTFLVPRSSRPTSSVTARIIDRLCRNLFLLKDPTLGTKLKECKAQRISAKEELHGIATSRTLKTSF
jgi:hypothetical protein